MQAFALRAAGIAALAFSAWCLPTAAPAQGAWPAQTVKVTVAFPAGGFADSVARVIAEPLGPRLGQTIVIENRGGAGGNIGARSIAQAEPDGYAVLVSTTATAINPTLYKSMGYAVGDLLPVAIVGSSPEVLVVHPSHPARTMAELLKPADGQPIQFGTAGVGSGSHLAGEYLLKVLAKVPATHVAFSGGAPAIQNLLGNHLNSMFGTMPAFTEHIRNKAMRGLGVASIGRPAAIPDVPTFAESGFQGFTAASWVGFFVPARTDASIVARLNASINEVLKDAAVRSRLERSGLEIMSNDVAATRRFFASEIEAWATRVKAVGVSVN